ncbi:glycosyltransferase [Metallibacterium scheffleri]
MIQAEKRIGNETVRIALIEFYADGHHASYLNYLSIGLARCGAQVLILGPGQIVEVDAAVKYERVDGVDRLLQLRGTRRQFAFFRLARKAIAEAKKWNATHIHFVYADWHLTAIAAAWLSSSCSADLALTIHWATGAGVGSDSWINSVRRSPHRAALRWLVRTASNIFVHHKEIAASLNYGNLKRDFDVVPYPSEPLPQIPPETRDAFRTTLGISKQDTLLLCFGGTRHDKGADLAVKCLARLPASFHLLIAGPPVHFQSSDLLLLACKANTESRLHLILRYIQEDEVAAIFNSSDVVLLPYRRTFSGQSGPLTQGACAGRTVVSAALPVLGDTVRKFKLGQTFNPADIDGMALAIQAGAVENPAIKTTIAFIEQHAPQEFASKTYSALIGHKIPYISD